MNRQLDIRKFNWRLAKEPNLNLNDGQRVVLQVSLPDEENKKSDTWPYWHTQGKIKKLISHTSIMCCCLCIRRVVNSKWLEKPLFCRGRRHCHRRIQAKHHWTWGKKKNDIMNKWNIGLIKNIWRLQRQTHITSLKFLLMQYSTGNYMIKFVRSLLVHKKRNRKSFNIM